MRKRKKDPPLPRPAILSRWEKDISNKDILNIKSPLEQRKEQEAKRAEEEAEQAKQQQQQQQRRRKPVARVVVVERAAKKEGPKKDKEAAQPSGEVLATLEDQRVKIEKLHAKSEVDPKQLCTLLKPFVLNKLKPKEEQLEHLDVESPTFARVVALLPKLAGGTLYDYTTLISGLGKLKRLDDALSIYEKILKPHPSKVVTTVPG